MNAFIKAEAKGAAGLEAYFKDVAGNLVEWAPPVTDIATYIRTYGRDAIAHVVRRN